MEILVPFDASAPKTRLSPVLDVDERREFAGAMLADVLAAIEASGNEPHVLATASVECDAPVTVADRPLTPTVNDALDDRPAPVGLLVADLPLATAESVDRLLAPEADVVMAPGIGGGTNGLVVRTDDFRVDFHGVSARDHREIAAGAGASIVTVDSFRLAVDVDVPADLAEVLLYGEGEAAEWLRGAGFRVEAGDGRVQATRPAEDGA